MIEKRFYIHENMGCIKATIKIESIDSNDTVTMSMVVDSSDIYFGIPQPWKNRGTHQGLFDRVPDKISYKYIPERIVQMGTVEDCVKYFHREILMRVERMQNFLIAADKEEFEEKKLVVEKQLQEYMNKLDTGWEASKEN